MMLMHPAGVRAGRAGRHAGRQGGGRDDEVQRGPAEGGGAASPLDGLHPPADRGARVSFAGGKPKVTDGPFAEAKEVVGRLLDDPGQVQGRGDRVGVALPRLGERDDRGSARSRSSRTSRPTCRKPRAGFPEARVALTLRLVGGLADGRGRARVSRPGDRPSPSASSAAAAGESTSAQATAKPPVVGASDVPRCGAGRPRGPARPVVGARFEGAMLQAHPEGPVGPEAVSSILTAGLGIGGVSSSGHSVVSHGRSIGSHTSIGSQRTSPAGVSGKMTWPDPRLRRRLRLNRVCHGPPPFAPRPPQPSRSRAMAPGDWGKSKPDASYSDECHCVR